jgi:Ser/Thr protein kinase RdoA (MazF antagonist)
MDVSEADYSELTPDRIISSVESLGLLSDGRILALNSYENRVYQVGIEDAEPVIAKFYRPGRWTDEQILEEHQFCFELADEDLPVVPPICFNSQSLHQFEGYRFSLFPRRGGRESDMDNPDNLAQLGRYLGRMHVVGAAKGFSFRPRIDLQTYGVESADFLIRHFIPDALTDVYESLSRDILLLIEQRMGEAGKIGFIRCHGDCHAGNILWRLGEPNFVDFDDARMAPGVQDLWMLLSGSREEQEAQLGIVINAYEQFIEFDDRQLQLVEPLRTLRMMHYAAWLARRWEDPAFPVTFPWFNTDRYWGQHILELREQMAALQEPPLRIG